MSGVLGWMQLTQWESRYTAELLKLNFSLGTFFSTEICLHKNHMSKMGINGPSVNICAWDGGDETAYWSPPDKTNCSAEQYVGMQRWGSTALNWVWAHKEIGVDSLELGVGMQSLTALNWVWASRGGNRQP